MKNYTVHEISKLLNFSQQAVRYQVKNNLPPHMIESRPNGAVCVTEEGLEFLRESMGKKSQKDNENTNNEQLTSKENTKTQTDLQIKEKEGSNNNEIKDNEQTNELIALLKQQAAALMEQLAVKDEQIASQARQIETLVESLKLAQQTAAAAQALHAGTIQKELNAAQTEPGPPQEQPIEQRKTTWFRRLLNRRKQKNVKF